MRFVVQMETFLSSPNLFRENLNVKDSNWNEQTSFLIRFIHWLDRSLTQFKDDPWTQLPTSSFTHIQTNATLPQATAL